MYHINVINPLIEHTLGHLWADIYSLENPICKTDNVCYLNDILQCNVRGLTEWGTAEPMSYYRNKSNKIK